MRAAIPPVTAFPPNVCEKLSIVCLTIMSTKRLTVVSAVARLNEQNRVASAKAEFLRNLYNERLHMILNDKAYLKGLRNDWKKVRQLAKRFESALKEQNISLEEEVVLASTLPCPENFDEEDEEKQASARQFAFKGCPSSTKEWKELDSHRLLCKDVCKKSGLPTDLSQMCLDFKGPEELPSEPESDQDNPCNDPIWRIPIEAR